MTGKELIPVPSKRIINRIALRSQIVILKGRGKHPKYMPCVFTDYGVAMLSGVLNSERAIQVNIQIIRAFTKLREMLATHADLRKKIEAMEAKYDQQFKMVFDAIKQLIIQEEKPKEKIGFKTGTKGQAAGRTLEDSTA